MWNLKVFGLLAAAALVAACSGSGGGEPASDASGSAPAAGATITLKGSARR